MSDLSLYRLLDNITNPLPSLALCRHRLDPNNTASCDQILTTNYTLLGITLFSSAVVVCVFSFLQRRVHPACCGRRPGLAIPLNMLNMTRYRLVYTVIFGGLTHSVLNAIVFQTSFNVPFYLEAFVIILEKLVYVLAVCLTYYPLFACVNAVIPLLGFIIGSVYSILLIAWIGVGFFSTVRGCEDKCVKEGADLIITIVTYIPVAASTMLIFGWYVFSLVRELCGLLTHAKSLTSPPVETQVRHYHLKRVSHLLRKHCDPTVHPSIWKKIAKRIYYYDPAFKYPLRFMATMIIVTFILYRFCLVALYYTVQVSNVLIAIRQSILDWISYSNYYRALESYAMESDGHNHTQLLGMTLNASTDVLQGVLLGFAIILPAAPTLSTILCAVFIFLTFRNVSDHLHRAARSDLSFLPDTLPSLQLRLAAAVKFPGYQTGYVVWAWMIYSLIFIVAGTAGMVLFYVLKYITVPVITYASHFLVGFLWTQAIFWFEFFVCKYVFLAKEYRKSKSVIINNRRLYHWFSYVMLFLNAFVGFVSAILRIMLSAVFGLLLLMRMDRVILMKGLERFDKAHKTYIGFIYLDYTQNNSVVNAFITLLQTSVHNRVLHRASCRQSAETNDDDDVPLLTTDELMEKSDHCSSETSRHRVSQQAFNRWMVAYTLLRNPSLVSLTGAQLEARRMRRSPEILFVVEHSNDEEIL